MKKSLLAVAAMGAFASAAQAQSSVTVYGILDAGYSNASTRVGAKKVNTSTIGQDAETNSRIGFRGTEDLGGGTSAFFTAETNIVIMNGGSPVYGPASTAAQAANSSTVSTANAGNIFSGNRQAFVGLSKKGIGRAALGTQYTVLHDAVTSTDVGQSNNVIGSVIRPIGAAAASGAGTGAQGDHLVRTTNALKFNSDKFAGFGLNAIYIQNNSNTTQTAAQVTTAPQGDTVSAVFGTNNYNGYGLSADYRWKKLYATVAYNSIKQEQTFVGQLTTTSATAALPGTEALGTQTNVRMNDTYAGAVYDFGMLKGYLAWSNRKLTGGLNSNQYLNRSAQQIGVRSFITPTIEGWASIGNGRLQTFGAGTPTANFNAWQLGSNYLLSKRTNLYAIYGQSLTSSTSSQTQGAAGSQFALGVRHTF
jgi:predicted porin